MARIIIDGEELQLVSLSEAPADAVAALQRATGLKLAELYTKMTDPDDIESEVFASKVARFFTEWKRGRRVAWAKLGELPLAQILPDADELRRQREEQGEDPEVPTSAPTASQSDGADDEPAPVKRPTRASSSSTSASRGSKSRSTSGSSKP